MAREDVEMGGDPPCWAHLFEDMVCCPPEDDEDDDAEIVDLAVLASAKTAHGTIWTNQSEELNANLLVFNAGQGVAEHVNLEVDVLVVGIAGEGVVEIDGARNFMWAGTTLLIPKGARRSTQATNGRFAYLTCHRRRSGLWPNPRT